MHYAPHDPRMETVLDRLNTVASAEFDGDRPVRTDLPTLQIFGLPRSGTTLVYQLMASTGVLGYVSNVMAHYWAAPHVGATLQVLLTRGRPAVSFLSLAGRTPNPLDPHEFGRFWRFALGHDRNAMTPVRPPVHAEQLQRQLDLVASVFDQPVVYKNFLVPPHVPFLQTELRDQHFLHVRRPALDVALSLLSVRRRLGIAVNEWFGPEPNGAHAEEPLPTFSSDVEQVAYQVRSLSDDIVCSAINDSERYLTVDYQAACRNPAEALRPAFRALGIESVPADVFPAPIRPSVGRHPEITDGERASLAALLAGG